MRFCAAKLILFGGFVRIFFKHHFSAGNDNRKAKLLYPA
ncbi:hypothetical protein FLA_4685 [Filimonas lacunae]|nr:hypothetical protein FLA_4685 [Filimonas lacunae]